MKKFQKLCAVLAALALGLICFSGCNNDTGGSSGGGNSNNEEEVTVVAKYVHEDASSAYFLFYSDGSFKCLDGNNTIYEGAYYGGTPTKTMSMTLEIKKAWDQNAGKPCQQTKDTKQELIGTRMVICTFHLKGLTFI